MRCVIIELEVLLKLLFYTKSLKKVKIEDKQYVMIVIHNTNCDFLFTL